MMPLVLIQVQHRRAHGTLVDRGHRHHVAGGREHFERHLPARHCGAVDELVDMFQRHRFTGGQRRGHGRRTRRFDPN